jgi:alpha-ribazole phosphatase CobZ
MSKDIKFNGFRAEITSNYRTLILRFNNFVKCLSSSIFNGGMKRCRAIVNHCILNDDLSNPKEYCEHLIKDLGLEKDTIVLLTGVKMSNLCFEKVEEDDILAVAFVTAGLSYTASAGEYISLNNSGTINIICIVNKNMSENCFVNGVQTITEAKVLTLAKLDIRSKFSKGLASGTTSDALALVSLGIGKKEKYSGSATVLGRVISKSVEAALEKAISKNEGIKRGRDVLKRLKERGICLEDIVDLGMKLYKPCSRNVRKELEKEVISAINDINVSSWIIAGMKLEEEGIEGRLYPLSKEEFEKDPVYLIADESLGESIANYIAGTWGIYNFRYYERHKVDLAANLGPFLDDVIEGLVAGCLAKIESRKKES